MISMKRIVQTAVYSVAVVLLVAGHGYAQNAGYFANNTESELDDQQYQKMIEEQTNQIITGVSFDYVGEGVYTLGVDDVINIAVLRHPEVSGDFIINKNGKIQYGFVGDILVAGMNKQEVKEMLTEVLSEYIVSPDVTVTISGYFSKVVYVIGEVARPGKIYMKGDTITIREALVQAYLPLITAKASKSTLITPSGDGSPNIRKVDVHKLLYKGDLRENYVMKPGDTLFIPPTVMAKALRVITPIAAPISAATNPVSQVDDLQQR